MKPRIASFFVLASVTLAACAVGPDYRTPQVDVPESFDANASAAAAKDEAALTHWWTAFQDPELESLVTRARRSNLDLKSAASRLREARAQEIVAGAARWPTANATGAGVRVHSNSNPLAALGGGQGGPPPTGAGSDLKLYSAGFDALWELDVFGGVRRAHEAAQAKAEAAEWQYRDAQVSLSAEVANAYLGLRTTQVDLAIVHAAVDRERELLHIAEERQRFGFVTELDVNQERAQLASTEAQLPSLEAAERSGKHAIAILLGEQPQMLDEELSTQEPQLPQTPQALPPSLPSELLRRRPDIRVAERTLASATAQVGVATADLYPKFNLIGVLSLASDSIGNLLDSDNASRVGAALIRWPLFQGGRTRTNIGAAQERREQAYFAYQKSVLIALQEAEDAIERYGAEQRRLVSLNAARDAARSSLDIARAQYRNGLVNYQSVLTASTTYLTAESQVAAGNRQLAQDLVALYKALGGGWE